MCRHSSTYSIHDNLVNWFAICAFAMVINYQSRQPELIDNYSFTWGAGMLWGYLLKWALEIGREWVKTWGGTP